MLKIADIDRLIVASHAGCRTNFFVEMMPLISGDSTSCSSPTGKLFQPGIAKLPWVDIFR